jgi:hypothetical protein
MPAITPRNSYPGAYLAALVDYLETATGLDWDYGPGLPGYGGDPVGEVALRQIQAPRDFSGSLQDVQAILLLQYQSDTGIAGQLIMLNWMAEVMALMREAEGTGTYNGLQVSRALVGAEMTEPAAMSSISSASRPELGLASGVVLHQWSLTYRLTVAGRYEDLL